jgi:hypothetical protein
MLNYTRITNAQIKLLPLNNPPNIVPVLLSRMTSCKQPITLTFEIPHKLLIMPQALCCLHCSFTKTKELQKLYNERNVRTPQRLPLGIRNVCTLFYVLR